MPKNQDLKKEKRQKFYAEGIVSECWCQQAVE